MKANGFDTWSVSLFWPEHRIFSDIDRLSDRLASIGDHFSDLRGGIFSDIDRLSDRLERIGGHLREYYK